MDVDQLNVMVVRRDMVILIELESLEKAKGEVGAQTSIIHSLMFVRLGNAIDLDLELTIWRKHQANE